MAGKVDLKPRKELLNPNFESYKLSLEPLPTYHQELEKDVDVSSLTENQLTSHHTKLFGAPNHLTPDLWSDNSVYLTDSCWTVRKVFVHENGKIDNGQRVFDIPEASEFCQTPGRVNVSMRFASQQFVLIADGAGRLFLLNSGDRGHNAEQWKILWKEHILGEDTVCSVVDAAHSVDDNKHDVVECLLVHVEDAKEENQHATHLTVITWITLSTNPDGKWYASRTRRLEGPRPFDYASVERGGGGVTIASSCPFIMTSDSVKAVTPQEESAGDWEMVGKEPQHPRYTWSQTAEDVTVQLTVPSDVSKPDVYVSFTHDHIDIGVKNSLTLLRGPLHDRMDVSTGTWSVEGQKLEVSFVKEREAVWDTLVVGDTHGEMTMDNATIAAIHERLKHLTSDQWNPSPDAENKPYNTQELEACDAVDDEECIYLTRIDGETHQISHQATISYNLLFSVTLEVNKSPALCLRHDVDGLLWQPETVGSSPGSTPNSASPWLHVGTLDAFGYIQASKTQRRFSSCAPNLSLAAIADCSRHVYLYRQRAPISSPLRNRRTSQRIDSVAKQHVVAVDPQDSILGLHVSSDHIFLATASRVYAVKVAQDA